MPDFSLFDLQQMTRSEQLRSKKHTEGLTNAERIELKAINEYMLSLI